MQQRQMTLTQGLPPTTADQRQNPGIDGSRAAPMLPDNGDAAMRRFGSERVMLDCTACPARSGTLCQGKHCDHYLLAESHKHNGQLLHTLGWCLWPNSVRGARGMGIIKPVHGQGVDARDLEDLREASPEGGAR